MGLRKDIIRWATGFWKNPYVRKEDYVNDSTPEWCEKHLNYTLITEKQDILKGRVLDLGCNNGALDILLARRGSRVMGVDLNHKALQAGKSLLADEKPEVVERLSFTEAFLQDLPFRSEMFDTVVMFDVFEHLFPMDQPKIMEEIKRVLKPSGHLFIAVPYGHHYDNHAHVTYFENEGELEKTLLAFGFKPVEIQHDQRQDQHGATHNRINALAIPKLGN
jgi:2-polyprenyl-3-methyl-5-hydroxy-6-metoxy-1,4-benzoquinol methylase